MPRFECLPNFQTNAVLLDTAVARKTKFIVWREPFGFQRITVILQILDDIAKILLHKMRQHESVVQFCTPADQAALVRTLPKARDERPQQKLLGQTHAGVRRHFEGAQFDQTKPATTAV